MERLENKLLDYAWGSRTALAELLDRPCPSPRPEAEMWMGDHPAAPSVLAGDAGGRTLAERISSAPDAELGRDVHRRFGGRLPFLLKVLAADQPLSLQAHPSQEQAREGFAREEEAGLPVSSPARSYKDPHHKPELLCALGPFEALCGFRRSDETLALFESLACPALDPVAALLGSRPGPEGIRAAFEALIHLAPERRSGFLQQALEACRSALAGTTDWRCELGWALQLAERYPGDMGAVSALMLNFVRLEAGEAIFLPAGNLHSYLKGVGIELMASSDNVLRGGLTPKHVDTRELMRVLDFRDGPVATVATRALGEHEREYVTPAPDFRLSVIRLDSGHAAEPARRGPEILLCIEGSATVRVDGATGLELARGQSVFVSAGDGPYRLFGPATIFRATVGDSGGPS